MFSSLDLALDAIGRGSSFGADDLAARLVYQSGSGAPSSVTPAFIGQHYLRTGNNTWYIAVGLTSSDWVLMAGTQVDGPGSSTDNAVARFDGTGGYTLQNSVVLIGDTGAVTGVTSMVMAGALSGVTTLGMSGALSGGTTIDCSGAITSSTAKSDYRKFLGAADVSVATVGTWTMTRTAQALNVLRHTAADDTSVLAIDITEPLRSTASKGLSLATIDVFWENATADLDAHSATLDGVTFNATTVDPTVTSMPITGTLAVGQHANVQKATLTVTTPAFLTTQDKVVLEITVNAGATSAYDFHGVRLNFSRNDL